MKTLNQFLEQGAPQQQDPKVQEVIEEKAVGAVVKQLARIGAKKLKSKKVKKAIYKTAKKIGSAGLEGAVSGAEERAKEAGHDTARNIGKKKKVDEGLMTMLGKKKKEKKAEKAMDAGARARRKVARRVHATYVSGSEDNVPDDIREAKVDKGRSDYGKASVRNKRKFGKEGEPAVFDASGERGKMIDQRRAEHKAKRGVKEDVIVEKDLSAAQRRALPDSDFALPGKGKGPEGKQAGSYPIPDATHARAALAMVAKYGTPEEKEKVRAAVRRKFPDIQQEAKRNPNRLVEPRDGVDSAKEVNRATRKAAFRPFNKEDKAFDYVVAKLRKQHGDDAVLTKGQKPKPPTAAQKKKNDAIRAQRAKEDHRDETEKATSGRYNDRSRSD